MTRALLMRLGTHAVGPTHMRTAGAHVPRREVDGWGGEDDSVSGDQDVTFFLNEASEYTCVSESNKRTCVFKSPYRNEYSFYFFNFKP